LSPISARAMRVKVVNEMDSDSGGIMCR